MAGDTATGVAIMQMSAELDEGDVFAMESLPLDLSDTTGDIHNRLAEIGSDLLIDVINKIITNQITAIPQDTQNITYADKITKQECELDFIHNNATQIIQKINALNPFPSAFFIKNNQRYKIHQAEPIEISGIAGMIDDNFVIYCQSNAIRPVIIQKEGRQKQHITDFLNGEKNNQA
jgi:methionyl-tRNA formyltransferase